MRVFIISHIADIDGLTPIILSELTFDDVNYELLEAFEVDAYMRDKMEQNFFDEYDRVYMTDLCVGKEVADEIATSSLSGKFLIIDHHYSNLDLNSYDFITVIDGENGIKESATSLYYKYLLDHFDNRNIKKNSVAYMVTLVRLSDTWEWRKFGVEEARNLSTLLFYFGADSFINNYIDFLKNNNEFYFTKTENILIETDRMRMQEYIEERKKNTIFKKVQDYRVGIVFAELYRSDLGESISEYYRDKIDFVIIINVSRSISYRSCKEDINVGAFAEIYGGKGHKLASGSPLPDDLKEVIINCIYGSDIDELDNS